MSPTQVRHELARLESRLAAVTARRQALEAERATALVDPDPGHARDRIDQIDHGGDDDAHRIGLLTLRREQAMLVDRREALAALLPTQAEVRQAQKKIDALMTTWMSATNDAASEIRDAATAITLCLEQVVTAAQARRRLWDLHQEARRVATDHGLDEPALPAIPAFSHASAERGQELSIALALVTTTRPTASYSVERRLLRAAGVVGEPVNLPA